MPGTVFSRRFQRDFLARLPTEADQARDDGGNVIQMNDLTHPAVRGSISPGSPGLLGSWPPPRRLRKEAVLGGPTSPLLVLLGALLLLFPDLLLAQEKNELCKSITPGSKLTSEVCELDQVNQIPQNTEEAQNKSKEKTNSGKSNWLDRWLRKVDEARASQPHFVSPIVTTHVLLVQQYRYDISWQQDPAGGTATSNYGASRGLEIIPTTRLEVGVFPPNYLVHHSPAPNGFGDFSFLVKYRVASGTEGHGDYFVGIFVGGSVPVGSPPNGAGHTIFSPAFAFAKGLGHWDVQTTIGGVLPASGVNFLGRATTFNTAVDYKLLKWIWPMLEQNSEFWSGGILGGKKQVFLTPGIVLGALPVAGRLHLAIGSGVQIAVTQFHQYNHRWIISVRFPF
jgi:hypothetical protein